MQRCKQMQAKCSFPFLSNYPFRISECIHAEKYVCEGCLQSHFIENLKRMQRRYWSQAAKIIFVEGKFRITPDPYCSRSGRCAHSDFHTHKLNIFIMAEAESRELLPSGWSCVSGTTFCKITPPGWINTFENVRPRGGSFLFGIWTPGVRKSNRKVIAQEEENNSYSFCVIYSSTTEQSNRSPF